MLAVRAPLATQLLHMLGEHGPVAALPDGQWLFLVEAGQPPEPLPGHPMHYHGSGGWVPLPPTRLGQGHLTWHIDPASTGWHPLRRAQVHHALRAGAPTPDHEPAATRATAQPTAPPAAQPRRRAPQRPSPSRRPRPTNLTLLVAGDRPLFEVTTQQPPG